MYEHHVGGMLDAIEKAAPWQFTGSVRVAAEKALKDYWADKIAVVWVTKDVLDIAAVRKHKIDEKEAREILRSILHKRSPYEIDWGVIDTHVKWWCRDRDIGEHLRTEIDSLKRKMQDIRDMQVKSTLMYSEEVVVVREGRNVFKLIHSNKLRNPVVKELTGIEVIEELQLEQRIRELSREYAEKFEPRNQ